MEHSQHSAKISTWEKLESISDRYELGPASQIALFYLCFVTPLYLAYSSALKTALESKSSEVAQEFNTQSAPTCLTPLIEDCLKSGELPEIRYDIADFIQLTKVNNHHPSSEVAPQEYHP